MFQNYWIPWDKEKEELWVKPLPDNKYLMRENNVPFNFKKGTYGADTRKDFSLWFSKMHGKTAVLVGIRTDESLQRLSIITSQMRINMYNDIKWSSKLNDSTYTFYPLYDWNTNDIWVANAKLGFDYNKTYDLMYYAGVPLADMRIASPFHSCGQENLKLYRALSPNTWSKMVCRVNGVNFTNIYGGTTVMGWKNITKPQGFTWQQYAEFLLSTLPEETRNKYLAKIEKSKWHWSVQGAPRDEKFIKQLEKEGVKIRRSGHGSNSCKVNTHKEVIYLDEMIDDTNVDEFKKAPSWKRVCIAIMKNDTQCLYMGFSRTREDMEKRKLALERYKNL
jgi:predicted phosphoadenosine phosphosulfate sulfurtransferase